MASGGRELGAFRRTLGKDTVGGGAADSVGEGASGSLSTVS